MMIRSWKIALVLLSLACCVAGCGPSVPVNQPPAVKKIDPAAQIVLNWLAKMKAMWTENLETFRSVKDVPSAQAAAEKLKEIYAVNADLQERRRALPVYIPCDEVEQASAEVRELAAQVNAEHERIKGLPGVDEALMAAVRKNLSEDPQTQEAHVAWAREMVPLWREQVEIFRAIVDAESARAAIPRLDANAAKFKALLAKQPDPKLAPNNNAELDGFVAEMREAIPQAVAEKRRIQADPAVFRIINEAELVREAPRTGLGESYLEHRQKFQTRLKKPGPSPQPGQVEALPEHVTQVAYESAGRQLKGWLYRPPAKAEGDKPRPGLVYLHGGFAFGAEDIEDARPFCDAGFVVFYPSLRGENGNEGNFEFCLGEIDDAAAAVRWLAQQPGVDGKRIFALGHSSGGMASALLSLYDDLPLVHTGSLGGLYGPEIFRQIPITPFAANDPAECGPRVLVGNLRWMKRPHYGYIGDRDFLMRNESVQREAKETSAPLTVATVPGDHHGSKAPGVEAYLKVVQESLAKTQP